VRIYLRYPALILSVALIIVSGGCLLDSDDGGSGGAIEPPLTYGSITVTGDMEGTFEFTLAIVIEDTDGNLTIGLADNSAPFSVIIDIESAEIGIYDNGSGLIEIRAIPLSMAIPAKPHDMPTTYSSKTDGAGGLVAVTTFDSEIIAGHFTGMLADGDRVIDVTGTFEIPKKTE
jgi:hypothetical protein